MNQKPISSLLLSFLTIVLISSPSYSSGITSNANSATCNNSTLETYTGTSNLQANWSANTIELHWYNGNTEITGTTVPSSCIYSGALNPPTGNDIPTKTGYTFAGWRVKSCFASSVCGLNGSAVNGLTYDYENDDFASGYNSLDGQRTKNTGTYGLTSIGTWAIKDTNGGIIKGTASCNNTASNAHETASLAFDNGSMTNEQLSNAIWGNCSNDAFKPGNTFNTSSEGQKCWCKMESYTPYGGPSCNVASPSWVFGASYWSPSVCASYCATACTNLIMTNGYSRRAVFGVSQ